MADFLYVTPRGRMLVASILFMITGIAALAAGLVVYFIFDNYTWILYDHQSLPLFYIWTGGIILFFVPFALYASNDKRHCAKKMLVIVMGIMFIFHIAASIAAFTYQVEVVYYTWNELRTIFPQYKGNNNYGYYQIQWMVDTIQRDFHCCGVDDRSEWLDLLNTSDTQGLPLSCCHFQDGSVYQATCTLDNGYWSGCGRRFGYYFAEYLLGLGITAAVLASIQGLLILLVLWAARSAKKLQSEENEGLTSNIKHEDLVE